MIVNLYGDILKSGAPTILHQVNCIGVMGAGLAKQVRDKHPVVFEKYREFALSRTPNELMGFSLWVSLSPDGQLPFIVNCFAQTGIGCGTVQTNYESLGNCFADVKQICESSYDNCTIAIPYKIGCGLAGGDWRVVSKIINDVFSGYNGEVQIWKF